jgi:hypothetical protein
MAHYALLDENNIVTQVLTGVDENISKIDIDGTEIGGSTEAWESFYGNLYDGSVCKRTSRNTEGGVHLEGGTPFRYNYAGIGWHFDPEAKPDGAFYAPKEDRPFSWTLDKKTYTWVAPIPKPVKEGFYYLWEEEQSVWVENAIENS